MINPRPLIIYSPIFRYIFSSDSFEASDTTEYESESEPELPKPIKSQNGTSQSETDKKRTPVKRPHVQRPIKKNRGPPPVRAAQKLQAKLDARAERAASGVSGSSQNEESESDLQDEIQLTSSDDEEITEDNFKIIFSKKHPDPLEADLKFDTHRFTKGFLFFDIFIFHPYLTMYSFFILTQNALLFSFHPNLIHGVI